MEFGEWENIRCLADKLESSSSSSSSSILNLCRICHEEEDENSSSMEAPCSCSGTLKFAHRRCIQRWCYEKGSKVCEICLQNFEPAYTVTRRSPSKPHSISTVITIRGSLAEHNYENGIPVIPLFMSSSQSPRGYIEPSTTSSGCLSFLRLLIMMMTMILLLRNLIVVLSSGADDYAFSLATVFALRAIGILLPFCLIMRLITVIHNAQKLHLLHVVEDDLEQQEQAID